MPTSADQLQELLDIQPQQNMSDKIYQQISTLIQNGQIPEGYIFPNENVMCQKFSIGRSTIREAYKALELYGYVTRTKKGTIVNSLTDIMGSTPLKAIATTVSSENFIEFRLMLEGQSAASAAERATTEELDKIQDIQNKLVASRNDGSAKQMAELDRNFHEAIARSTHNPLLINAMTAVAEIWNTETKRNFFKAATTNPEIFDKMITQHQAILDAIKSHDQSSAAERMREHITSVSA